MILRRDSGVQAPAQDVLDKQVLERMMTERSLLQFAKENGVRVDDTMIERAILRIAQENKLSAEDFRKALAKENIDYPRYREDVRHELTVQRLRDDKSSQFKVLPQMRQSPRGCPTTGRT